MRADTLDVPSVLAESGTDDPHQFVHLGIEAAQQEQFERGLIFLAEAYVRLSRDDKEAKLSPALLSYYGLCLALHKGRIKEAAEYCQLAIEREFFNGEHYLNLARVWAAGRSRRKAIEALDRGLAVEPRSPGLHKLRDSLGMRRSPVLPFLHRDNPLNVTLGRARTKLEKPKRSAPATKK